MGTFWGWAWGSRYNVLDTVFLCETGEWGWPRTVFSWPSSSLRWLSFEFKWCVGEGHVPQETKEPQWCWRVTTLKIETGRPKDSFLEDTKKSNSSQPHRTNQNLCDEVGNTCQWRRAGSWFRQASSFCEGGRLKFWRWVLLRFLWVLLR